MQAIIHTHTHRDTHMHAHTHVHTHAHTHIHTHTLRGTHGHYVEVKVMHITLIQLCFLLN
jgi:hypothetical protein